MQNNISQITNELTGLAGKVSTADRMAAAIHLSVHLGTIDRYLKGEVKKEPFGLLLLGYLKKCIADREKSLS